MLGGSGGRVTSAAVHLPLATGSPGSSRPQRRLPLLEQYLRDQQDLSAAERFARRHAEDLDVPKARTCRDLIPLTKPSRGQQYAFSVNLDQCSGCKACVTACHSLNGLDEGETWRSVGLLHGGTAKDPVRQTVTTACHHCVEPACMSGCPVGAYEKSPTTGIVKHLDDQCIGCQYCTFTCPYDAPKYNASLGIVRKCDMCSDRLAVGEAPACVAACPSEAIAITIIDPREAIEDAQGDAFLPGAPSPGITIPTTRYNSEKTLPRNLLPADFYAVAPSHQHTPLVLMLVLTQLSVGALCVEGLAGGFLPPSVALLLRPLHTAVAVALGLLAMASSIFHLGRPLYAFRAILGLRTSWMSREILAFGLFAPLAVVYAALSSGSRLMGLIPLAPNVIQGLHTVVGGMVTATGLAGVTCSVLLYHVTRRPWWSASRVGFKFAMTTVVLGLATTIGTFAAAASIFGGAAGTASIAPFTGAATRFLAMAAAIKLAFEFLHFAHLRDRRLTPLKRTAILMRRELGTYTFWRFFLGIVGGILLPLVWPLLADAHVAGAALFLSFAMVLAGELLERTLFFAAASSPGMPGGIS